MESEITQQQQIQALLANVEEFTRQNEELRKTMESQNAKCRQTGENQNEEESNFEVNIRKEMDELKSAMEDKSRGNLDGMI